MNKLNNVSSGPARSWLVSLTMSLMLMLSAGIQADEDKYQSPEAVAGAVTISQVQAKQMHDEGTVFIDVRNPRLYAKGHIPGAIHLDYKYDFDEKSLGELVAKDQAFVIYCSGIACSRSSNASEKAVRWGFAKVQYFRGGIVDWRKAGYETETSE